MNLGNAITKAEKIVTTIDKILPIAYESDKSAELANLVLELKGLAVTLKADLKNAAGKRSNLPVNFPR